MIVQGRDHNPPHFHVKGPDINALVGIDPVVILRGRLPSDLWAEVQAWAIAHGAALVAAWNTLNPQIPTA
ncbi:hypothetical protein J2848_003424 [Azospirillum lipoferum]|uniref:DUF4160 domain-containing protein n=1 Tax=Azospirillum lipoferum TaxID=193 RepID=A0A5A9GLS7_AZOLI|nr:MULTISPECIES: DUF4160 domain-containing protein [Azospirillum]KAA0595361.1 DUF4160 domain-containing protein [Azospirillum lipoferum]MCP1611746.1 hypothetical protein [Azospirillum lipoferum]MDW5533496.1 DUF4160 domain-containing protein [Azospirillum sp. NL1]